MERLLQEQKKDWWPEFLLFHQWGTVIHFYYKNLYPKQNLNSKRRRVEPLETEIIMIRIQYKIKQIESSAKWEKYFGVGAVNSELFGLDICFILSIAK